MVRIWICCLSWWSPVHRNRPQESYCWLETRTISSQSQEENVGVWGTGDNIKYARFAIAYMYVCIWVDMYMSVYVCMSVPR